MSTEQLTKEYYLERLDSTNLADVEKLHTAVYGKMPPPGFFTKKYDSAFTGLKYIGLVAYNNQKIAIGYYGVIPCFVRFQGRTILAAQSADTMTHPAFRYKGLFVELSNLTFQLCRDNGINLVFGFPNQNSLPGAINKLGWQMTERMDCFIIQTGTFSFARVLKKIPFIKRMTTVYRRNILKRYLLPQQGIENSVFGDGFAGVNRDAAYLKYKTYTDTYVIKIGESKLWIKLNNELLIGDITVLPADFDGLMIAVKKLARKLGAKEIHFHNSPGTTLHGLFSKSFASVPSFPVLFQDFESGVPISEIKFTSADIDTF